jgi:DNA-binding transcriptional regulator LsrR (DeoR family)
MLFAEYLDDDAVGELRSEGAVGDICMRFFDADGQPVKGTMPYLFSIELEHVRAIPHVVAVACGASKAAAILGAAKGRYFDTLITDEAAAREIVRLHESAERAPRS